MVNESLVLWFEVPAVIRQYSLLSAFLLMVLAAFSPSHAADITVSHGDSVDIVRVDGEITQQDPDEFEQVTQGLGEMFNRPVIVLLNSPGGNMLASLAIGETLRSHGFATGVVDNALCASGCAMIWVAGMPRFLGNSAKLGFHAAYTITDDDKKESGQANALVGAYLDKLGLSYAAVAYATAAGPDQMQWLHPADAQSIGIKVEVFPDPAPPAPVAAAAPPPTVVAPPAATSGSPAEQQAKSLVLAYYADWSRSGTDVENLARYYGNTAAFYGSPISRDKIMEEKRKFSVRWPIRHYTIQPGTLFAQCSDTCSVTGVVQWDVSSIERNAHSTGTANFVLKIALNEASAGGVILSENGAVLSAHNDALSAAQTSLSAAPSPPPAVDGTSSTAFAAGRQARLSYEAWFNNLPDSDYRRGAEFWAANRSLTPPPSCTQAAMSADWQSGCFAGQTHLAYSDARRRTEKDFRAGWNSL
jgi:ATP-dependent protease ClpP protease subunit